VINQLPTFARANDISNPMFNPVISKIENFMAKKEKKNVGEISNPKQRLSFLQIRNLWTNQASAGILDRSAAATVSSSHINDSSLEEEKHDSTEEQIRIGREHNEDIGECITDNSYASSSLIFNKDTLENN
jgi:hypothetical protein